MSGRKRIRRAHPFGHVRHPYDPRSGLHLPLGPSLVSEFEVVAVCGDALLCTDVDGASHIVAKPWDLTESEWDGQTFGDYSYAATGTTDERTRTETATSTEVTETVTPAYAAGVKILAVQVRDRLLEVEVSGLSGVNDGTYAAHWEDVNTAGRAWSAPSSAATDLWRYSYAPSNPGLAVTASGQSTIPFASGDFDFSEAPAGLTVASGVFTIGAELANRVLVLGAYASIGDGNTGNGFQDENSWNELVVSTSAFGLLSRANQQGVADRDIGVGAPNPHDHRPVRQEAARLSVSSSVILPAGETISVKWEQFNNGGITGYIQQAHFWLAAFGEQTA